MRAEAKNTRRKRGRLGTRTIVATTLFAAMVVSTPSATQETAPDDVFVGVFADPTALARDIDARVSGAVAACMQGQGYEYFVTPFARFDLEAVSAQEVFAPGLERSFGELVAQLADGTDLAVDPLDAFFDPTVLDAGPSHRHGRTRTWVSH